MKRTKVRFAANQVVRVEEKQANGRKYRNYFMKLTSEQRDHFRRSRLAADAEGPPKRSATQRIEMILGDDEAPLLTALDDYVVKHKLPNRGAVLRVALAKLLDWPKPQNGSIQRRKRQTVKKSVRKKTNV